MSLIDKIKEARMYYMRYEVLNREIEDEIGRLLKEHGYRIGYYYPGEEFTIIDVDVEEITERYNSKPILHLPIYAKGKTGELYLLENGLIVARFLLVKRKGKEKLEFKIEWETLGKCI